MAAGFEVKTDTGIVQVDATYKNLALLSKHSVSVTGGSGWLAPYSATFTAPAGSNRVFALRSGTPAVVSRVVGDQVTIATTSPTTVEVFVFADIPATVGASGAALVVYNADGEVTFSSDMRYMRVVGAAMVPGGTGSFNYSNLPWGTYAAALAVPRVDVEEFYMGNDPFYRVFRDFVRTHPTGAEVALAEAQILPFGGGGLTIQTGVGGQLLIFDVSGY